jgi:DNA repair exonuclease SbcCD nuclease subunit
VSRFAFAADLHLRRCVWNGRPTLAGDAYAGLVQIVDYCVEQKINLVLGGDVFDSTRPPSEAVVLLKQQAARMTGVGLKLFTIDGNHDGVTPSWADLLDDVTFVDGQLFTPSPGVTAFGLSYRPATQLQKDLANVPHTAQVLVCHQLMDWAFPRDGVYNMKAEWVPRSVRFVCVGDFHKPVQHEDDRGITYVYPGSVALQNLTETPVKGFVVVGHHAGVPYFDFERVVLRTRPVVEVTINTEDQIGQFQASLEKALADPALRQLPEAVRTPIVNVSYNSDIPGAAERITSAVAGRAHLWAYPFSFDNLVDPNAPAAAADGELSIDSVLATLVDPKTKPELFGFVHELLTREPSAVIGAARTRCGVGV